MAEFNPRNLTWTRAPKCYSIDAAKISIITEPGTDLWQRTYYGFQNDNAPVLQMTTSEKFFSFIVKTEFVGKVYRDKTYCVQMVGTQIMEGAIHDKERTGRRILY